MRVVCCIMIGVVIRDSQLAIDMSRYTVVSIVAEQRRVQAEWYTAGSNRIRPCMLVHTVGESWHQPKSTAQPPEFAPLFLFLSLSLLIFQPFSYAPLLSL